MIIHNASSLGSILMISAVLILSGYSGINGTRAKYKAKHQDLIREIENKVRDIIILNDKPSHRNELCLGN